MWEFKKRHFDKGVAALIQLIVAFCPQAALRAEPPDPVALLRGVEQVRTGIRSGKIEMAVLMEKFHPYPQRDEQSLAIVFDGVRFTTRQGMRDLHLKSEAAFNDLRASNNDRDRLVKEGKAEWRDNTAQCAWDGNRLLCSDFRESAMYLKPPFSTANYAFDPRTLGVATFPYLKVTVPSCLLENSTDVKLIGPERIRDELAWHVVVKYNYPKTQHFWIVNNETFPALKVIEEYGNGTSTRELEATYDASVAGARLPSVTVFRKRVDGKIVSQVTMRVTDVGLDVEVGPHVGTLASLDIPLGCEVSDELLGKRLGYWNGEDLSEDKSEAIRIGQQRERERALRTRTSWWPWAASIGTMVLLGAASAWWRLKRLAPGS